MLRKTMITLCAVASLGMLAPEMVLARGGGGGGAGGHGGGGGGGFGGHGGFGGGGGFGARSFGGGSFSNSFARAAPAGTVGAVQGSRVASGNFGQVGRGGFNHGFRHGRHFFADGGFWGPGYYDDYWGYPDYAYDDSYYDNGGCYVVQRRVHTSYGWRVRPVQVCG
jgi:hypothetical protein